MVLDGPSKRSRGFAFIYFDSVDDSEKAREALNGTEIAGFTIRVDFSITNSAHRPTPGVYFHHGKATRPGFRGRGDNRGGRGGRGEYRGRGDYRGRGGYYRDDRYYERRPPPPSGYYDRGWCLGSVEKRWLNFFFLGYDRYDKYDRDYYGPPRYREESRYHDYHPRERDPREHRDRERYYEDRYRGEDRYREDRYREADRYERPPRDYYERDRHYERGYERYPPSHHYPSSSSRRSPSPGPPPRRPDY